jgi:hypothetical protein
LFESYVRRLARRHFAGVHWTGPGLRQQWAADPPTIFVANHTNWWDGFLAYLVCRTIGLGFQVLMDARQLRRYRTFLRLGALPLRRERPLAAYADLAAAAAYLRPGVGLWVFPEGERHPAGAPLGRCQRGVAHLMQSFGAPIRLCPVALRYTFLGEQLPEAFVLVGESWTEETVQPGRRARAALMATLESRLNDVVGRLDAILSREQIEVFEPLAQGRLSINKRLDRFRHAVGLLGGRFEARNG